MKKLFQLFFVIFINTSIFTFNACEDDKTAEEGDETPTITNFGISRIDVETTGDSDQSQPELIRFVNDTRGVIVNSKQNTLDFITITPTDLSMSGESVQITDDPEAECSSVDVSVDESIIAVVATKGSCERGSLYLVDATSLTKYGPYELGYNPDAVDISVDNEYVVVVNEFDYEDGVDGGCDSLGFPGVSVWDISAGLGAGILVKDMKMEIWVIELE